MDDKTCNIIAYALVLVLLIIVGYVSYSMYRKLYPSWRNTPIIGMEGAPAKEYRNLIDEFGKPTYIAPNKGGFALWAKHDLAETKTGFIWEKVMIVDDNTPHLYPAPHNDFVYGWYILHVPDEKLQALLEITDAMIYDPMKKSLMVRCQSMCCLVVGAYVALMLCEGKIEPQNSQTEYYERITEIMNMEKVNKMEKYQEYITILAEGIARSEIEIQKEKNLTSAPK